VLDLQHAWEVDRIINVFPIYYCWTDQIGKHPVTEGVKTVFYPAYCTRWDDNYTTIPLFPKDKAWASLVKTMPGTQSACLRGNIYLPGKWIPWTGFENPDLLVARDYGKGRIAVSGASDSKVKLLPGLDMGTDKGDHFLIVGHTMRIRPHILTPDRKQLDWTGHMLLAMGDVLPIVARPQLMATPREKGALPPELYYHCPGIAVATYRDGKQVDDGSFAYRRQVNDAYHPSRWPCTKSMLRVASPSRRRRGRTATPTRIPPSTRRSSSARAMRASAATRCATTSAAARTWTTATSSSATCFTLLTRASTWPSLRIGRRRE